jgi:opacity protein-like surface antigen
MNPRNRQSRAIVSTSYKEGMLRQPNDSLIRIKRGEANIGFSKEGRIMRKLHLFTSLVFMLVVSSTPKVFAQSPVELGVRGGYNSSNATFDPDPFTVPGTSKSSGSGFWVGGAARLPISDLIAITAEPRYIQYGLKVQTTSFGQTTTFNTKLGYLQIPLFLDAGIGTDHFRLFAFTGPELGFRLSAKEDVDFLGQTTQSTDVKDQFKSTSVGFAFGGGIEYQIAPGVAFIVDARYSHGLSNVSNVSTGTPSNFAVRYYGVQVGGGLMFALR